MADFAATTGLALSLNTGTAASGTSATQVGAVWTVLSNGGTAGLQELRFSDVNTAGATASASWPQMTRPGATGQVNFQYAFQAVDGTGLGYLGTTSATPLTWANSNFNDKRWTWDNLGTFGSAPIFTAYLDTSHAAITRSPSIQNGGVANMLQGSTTDTGATARSYMKANLWGRVSTAGAPGAAATNAPVVTDGATGTITTTTAAAWLTNYQGFMGDTDFITAGFTPAATTTDSVQMLLTLFTGPNMVTGTYSAPVISCKYTFA